MHRALRLLVALSLPVSLGGCRSESYGPPQLSEQGPEYHPEVVTDIQSRVDVLTRRQRR